MVRQRDQNGGHKMTCLKALCIALLLCLCHEVLGAGQPNVIVILTDDQGWGDLSHQRE